MMILLLRHRMGGFWGSIDWLLRFVCVCLCICCLLANASRRKGNTHTKKKEKREKWEQQHKWKHKLYQSNHDRHHTPYHQTQLYHSFFFECDDVLFSWKMGRKESWTRETWEKKKDNFDVKESIRTGRTTPGESCWLWIVNWKFHKPILYRFLACFGYLFLFSFPFLLSVLTAIFLQQILWLYQITRRAQDAAWPVPQYHPVVVVVVKVYGEFLLLFFPLLYVGLLCLFSPNPYYVLRAGWINCPM